MSLSREEQRNIDQLTRELLHKNGVLEEYKNTVKADKFDLTRLKPTDHAKRIELEERIRRYEFTEIPRIGLEIDKIESQIAKIKNDNRKIEKEAEEALAKSREPQDKKVQIDRLKKIYKGGPKFDRFMFFVTGRAPKWGKLNNMSLNELRYMEKTSKGETFLTRNVLKTIEKTGENKNQTIFQIEKRKKEYKWSRFVDSLQDLDKTKNNAAFEAKKGGL